MAAPILRIFQALVLLAASLYAGPVETAELGRGPWVFAYFAGQTAGLRLAVSTDGLAWLPVNAGQPVFRKPFAEVFRDPSVSRGPDGLYRMVWTTAWKDHTSMGLASSRDLLHWTGVREVPLMGGTPEARNVWAPELFFDAARRRWIAYWSSSVDGRFTETRPPDPSWNNRMYYAESVDDLRTFTAERLLYDEGFITNDGFLLSSKGDSRGNYCLAVKRVFSTPAKHGIAARIYLAFGDQPTGPFRLTGEPITGDLPFCEGPAITRVGRWYYCYFDTPKAGRMSCVRSETLKAGSWDNISGRVTLPAGAQHGSVFPVPREVYQRLLRYRERLPLQP